jgi:hypothetical protein
MPIYRNLVDTKELIGSGGPRIRLVWAVHKLAETQWAFPTSVKGDVELEADDSGKVNDVEVFVTRPFGRDLQTGDPGEDIEMAENEQLLSTEEQLEKPQQGFALRTLRPKLSAIVDEVFAHGNKVAVIVCGPHSLSDELSRSVEQWVRKGHEVYWYNETFGW